MRIALRFKDDVAILSLSGKFVAGSDGPFLRQKVQDLLDAGTRKLLFNFGEVPYIDSTGLGFLAGSRETAQQAGARIVLAGINEHVKKILDGVQLTQFFELAENEASAMAKLSETASSSPPAATPGATPKASKSRKHSVSPPSE